MEISPSGLIQRTVGVPLEVHAPDPAQLGRRDGALMSVRVLVLSYLSGFIWSILSYRHQLWDAGAPARDGALGRHLNRLVCASEMHLNSSTLSLASY